MIQITWDNGESRGTLARDGGPLPVSDDLFSAVVASLFVDAPRGGDVPAGQTRGGYWADRYAEDPSDVWGSRIWQRAKQDEATRQTLEQDVRDALAWMGRLGMTRSIEVEVEVFDAGRFAFNTKIERADGDRWSAHWEVTFATA